MESFVLYCKSYSVDVKRLVRLARTVERFNTDNIPFYVSVPQADLTLFKSQLGGLPVQLLTDESIIAANPGITQDAINGMPGNISQQIVKSEFWRLGISQTYLCLDSDCQFIRPFALSDFLASEGVPYTVIDEGRDLMLASLTRRNTQILDNFRRESTQVQEFFDRRGKHYNFGPNPPIWDRRVWLSLDEKLMRPRGLSLLDLILKSPNEFRWYGEALLKYKAIDLMPSQSLFKVYHYAWQLSSDRKANIDENQLATLYCGVLYQSAWEREMDWPSEGGQWTSHLARRLRRGLGRM
jgi:hypothetical protein